MNAISKRNLLLRHWKWFIPLLIIVFTIFFISPIGNTVSDIAKVYSDSSIYEVALDKANKNEQVIDALGILEPISKFAIVEGQVVYSNNNDSVNITVRIKGSKNKGKFDIDAFKFNGSWEYQTLKIRIKDPKETIVILE